MTKFIVLTVLIVFFGFVYWRLRPYIRLMRNILRTVRGTGREELNAPDRFSSRARNVSSAKLVRCDSCGMWTAQTKAIQLRSSASFYCSHNCLELAADAVVHKTAGRSVH